MKYKTTIRYNDELEVNICEVWGRSSSDLSQKVTYLFGHLETLAPCLGKICHLLVTRGAVVIGVHFTEMEP